MTKPIAIVAGYLIGNPLGGHVLSILHYLVGLKRLGYDVVFVECFEWSNRCFNPRTQTRSDDPSYGIGELCRYFRELDIGRWCYVDINGTFHGVTREEMTRICRESALLLSLWTVTWLPEFMECRKRIFIDLDPGFTQFAMLPTPSRSTPWYASPLDFHFRFSYGSRIGKPDCPIPTHGLSWLPTRPPVALELLPYRFTPNAGFFTTVMSWSARKPIVYEGVEYGQKDVEFWRRQRAARADRRGGLAHRRSARGDGDHLDVPRLHRAIARRVQCRGQPGSQEPQRLVQRPHGCVPRVGQAGHRARHWLFRVAALWRGVVGL
jgi:hypothetical protein